MNISKYYENISQILPTFQKYCNDHKFAVVLGMSYEWKFHMESLIVDETNFEWLQHA